MDIKNWQLHNPGRYACIGPSQSGKSELVLKIIKDRSIWQNPPKDVQYIAPTLEDRQDYLNRLSDITIRNGGSFTSSDKLPENDASYNHNSFMVIDDILSFPKKDIPRLKELSVRGSHHNKVTLILTQQVPHPKGEDFIAINKNLTGKFLLYQTSDLSGINIISSRTFGNHFLLNCLFYAKDVLNCNYIFINHHPFTTLPRQNICYTKLFSTENSNTEPHFFDSHCPPSVIKSHAPQSEASVMVKQSKHKQVKPLFEELLNLPLKDIKKELKLLSHSQLKQLASFVYKLNKKSQDIDQEKLRPLFRSSLARQRKVFKRNFNSPKKLKQISSQPLILEKTLIKVLPLIKELFSLKHGFNNNSQS